MGGRIVAIIECDGCGKKFRDGKVFPSFGEGRTEAKAGGWEVNVIFLGFAHDYCPDCILLRKAAIAVSGK